MDDKKLIRNFFIAFMLSTGSIHLVNSKELSVRNLGSINQDFNEIVRIKADV